MLMIQTPLPITMIMTMMMQMPLLMITKTLRAAAAPPQTPKRAVWQAACSLTCRRNGSCYIKKEKVIYKGNTAQRPPVGFARNLCAVLLK